MIRTIIYFTAQQYGSGNLSLQVNSIKVNLITFFFAVRISVKMSCNCACTSVVTNPRSSIDKDFRNRVMFSSVITFCLCWNLPCKTNQLRQIISSLSCWKAENCRQLPMEFVQEHNKIHKSTASLYDVSCLHTQELTLHMFFIICSKLVSLLLSPNNIQHSMGTCASSWITWKKKKRW